MENNENELPKSVQRSKPETVKNSYKAANNRKTTCTPGEKSAPSTPRTSQQHLGHSSSTPQRSLLAYVAETPATGNILAADTPETGGLIPRISSKLTNGPSHVSFYKIWFTYSWGTRGV